MSNDHPTDEELSVLNEWLITRGRHHMRPSVETVQHVVKCAQCQLIVLETIAQMLDGLVQRHENN